MRIALFSGNYNYLREGANQALNRLVDYLQRSGDEVRVYSPVTATPAFEPAGTLVPVRSVRLPVRSEFQLALGLPRAVRHDLRRFAPDVVHLSTPDILGVRAQTFAKRRGIPVIASLHTRFETYLGYYGLDWARPLVDAHLRRFYRRCDHVLAPTPALVAELKGLRGDDQVSLWSRGVDRALFNPNRRDRDWRRSNGWADEDVVVLFFGRLVLEKNVQVYASVVRALQARHPRIRPLIVGSGPAAHLVDIPRAVLAGHLEGEELARAIASADVLLHPSKSESFGNVVLEAMASGLAIVCARTASASTLIEHGRNGILCSDDGGYEPAIAALIADPGRRRELGTAARCASADYVWDRESQRVANAYRTLAPDA